jgi:hypothetical protein
VNNFEFGVGEESRENLPGIIGAAWRERRPRSDFSNFNHNILNSFLTQSPLTIAARPFHSLSSIFAAGLKWGNNDNHDRGRAVGGRVADFSHADDQAQRKHAMNEELQTHQDAVGRLDQLFNGAAALEQAQRNRATEEETPALRAAAARLDQLLVDIGPAGKRRPS